MVAAGCRHIVLLGLLIGALIAGVGAVHALGEPTESPRGEIDGRASTHAVVDTVAVQAGNNSSLRHERREDLSEGDDQDALQQWLANRLGSHLEESSILLEQGEYERAKSRLNESYREDFEKYVEVTGATNESTVEAFENASESQQKHISTTQQYQNTYQAYQEAKQAGNDTRARKLARELQELNTQLQRSESNVTAANAELEARSEMNVSYFNRTVSNITKNVSAQQTEIRREMFTNTSLTVQNRSATASFGEPLQLRGSLVASNGTALANRRIKISVGKDTVWTNTTANGSFSASLRPKTSPLGRQPVSVEYVPRATAVYFGSNTTVPVNITQSTPKLTLARTPTTAAFNETISVSGRVRAANVSVGNITVDIAINDTVLDTVSTAPNGTFRFQEPLPPGIPPGEHPVTASLPVSDRALAPVASNATVRVVPTQTQLSVAQRNRSVDPPSVTLLGRLTTASGAPLANESVAFRAGGTVIGTATTNATGHYREYLAGDALASAVGENASTSLTVLYPGRENVEETRAQIQVQLDENGGSQSWVSKWPRLALGGLIVIGLLGGLLHRRTGLDWWGESASADAAKNGDPVDSGPSEYVSTHATPDVGQRLHDHALAQLEAGHTDTAVQAAYTAVRQQTIDALEWEGQASAAQTYWEFYHACQSNDELSDAACATLRELTEHYERAQFTPTALAEDAANDAIKLASDFLSATHPSGSPESPGETTSPSAS
jgi:hypothetical protein